MRSFAKKERKKKPPISILQHSTKSNIEWFITACSLVNREQNNYAIFPQSVKPRVDPTKI